MSNQDPKNKSSSIAATALGLGTLAAALDTANANVSIAEGAVVSQADDSSMLVEAPVSGTSGAADALSMEQGTQDTALPIDDLIETPFAEVSDDVLEQVALLDKDFQNVMPEPELLQALAAPESLRLEQNDILLAGDPGGAAAGAGAGAVDGAGLAGAAGAEAGIGAFGTIAAGGLGAGGVAAIINKDNNNNDTVASENVT